MLSIVGLELKGADSASDAKFLPRRGIVIGVCNQPSSAFADYDLLQNPANTPSSCVTIALAARREYLVSLPVNYMVQKQMFSDSISDLKRAGGRLTTAA